MAAGLDERVVVEEQVAWSPGRGYRNSDVTAGIDYEDPVVTAVGDHQITRQPGAPRRRGVGRGGTRLRPDDVRRSP